MTTAKGRMIWPSIPAGSIAGMNYSGLHDSSVAIVAPNGEIVYACSEERLSRVKTDGRFPKHLIDVVDWSAIDTIVLPYGRPDPHIDIEGLSRDDWVGLRKRPMPTIYEEMPPLYAERMALLPKPSIQVEHHLAHAATAYFLNGIRNAAVLTFDAGAFNSPWYAAWYVVEDGNFRQLGGLMAHRSPPISRLYTAVTALLGFTPNKHEGKVTALAAHGKVTPAATEALNKIHREILDEAPLMSWVNAYSITDPPHLVIDRDVRDLALACLDGLPMSDIAATLQQMAESQVIQIATELQKDTGLDSICLAGGLFANVKINKEVMKCGFKKVFIAPPMTDDGLALGGALLEAHRRGASCIVPVRTMCLGPAIEADTLDEELKGHGVVFRHLQQPARELAELIHRGDLLAVCEGRMEYGPRALGRRSIIVAAVDPDITDILNHKLRRTEFMPFAPILRAEDAPACFVGPADFAHTAEFMTIAVDCTELMKSKCPAVVHVDGTARPQLVHADQHPLIHQILTEYVQLSGRPALVNTSFNVHEEPIVCSAEDALKAFFHSELDHLFLNGRLISRIQNMRCPSAFLVRKRAVHRTIRAQTGAARQVLEEIKKIRGNLEWTQQQWHNWQQQAEQAVERERAARGHLDWTEGQRKNYEELMLSWRKVAEEREQAIIELERVNGLLEAAQQPLLEKCRRLEQAERETSRALAELRQSIEAAAQPAPVPGPEPEPNLKTKLKALFPRESLHGRVARKLVRMARDPTPPGNGQG